MNIKLDNINNRTKMIEVFIVLLIVGSLTWLALDKTDKTNKYCFIELNKNEINKGGYLPFTYNYVDRQTNVDYAVTPTKAYIKTPEGKLLPQRTIENMLAAFPDDFIDADANKIGKYEIYFENSEINKNSKTGVICSAKKVFTIK